MYINIHVSHVHLYLYPFLLHQIKVKKQLVVRKDIDINVIRMDIDINVHERHGYKCT
jgi:hypothetical protein